MELFPARIPGGRVFPGGQFPLLSPWLSHWLRGSSWQFSMTKMRSHNAMCLFCSKTVQITKWGAILMCSFCSKTANYEGLQFLIKIILHCGASFWSSKIVMNPLVFFSKKLWTSVCLGPPFNPPPPTPFHGWLLIRDWLTVLQTGKSINFAVLGVYLKVPSHLCNLVCNYSRLET